MLSRNPAGIIATILDHRRARGFLAGAFVLAAGCGGAHADGVGAGVRFEPPSNGAEAADEGVRAHTFIKMMKPMIGARNLQNHAAAGLPPYTGYGVETPASLECIYGFTTTGAPACNPNQVSSVAPQGSAAIAIVDAYDYPAAQSDLAAFSAQFGLPAPSSANFQVVYANGKPANGSGSGWDLEAALDIEYARAMAPKAKIILVEARSSSLSDLFTAVQVAANLVAQAGGGQVSMSWGGSEFSYEASYDSVFNTKNVVYYAAAGDNPGTIYPCVSPNVVCVGGTSNRRNAQNFAFQGQFAWSSTGGGPSQYENLPSFQQGLSAQIGGTSAATPITAGLDNAAGNFAASSGAYLQVLYSHSGAERTDVTSGFCGFNYGLADGQGWGFCTGYGVPRPLVGGMAKL